MWQPAARWALGWVAAQKLANDLMGWTLNRDEAYVGRIKREFNLRSTAKARALYDSNRAYWENLYGDDPVTSPNHPASPPKSLLPRQPRSIDPGYSFLEPAPTYGGAVGRFGTAGEFVPGPATSSRPLYEMQSFGSPPFGLAPPDATGDNRPVRRLSARNGNAPVATVFDSGAPAVPFVSSSAIPGPGQSGTFNQRFPALDDLEVFRRQWLKTFMEP